MNIDAIETIIKQSCKDAYDDFKHTMANSPFDKITEGYVTDALAELEITIGTKYMKKVMSSYTPSPAQMQYINARVDHYKAITLRVAHRFGMKMV